MTTRLEKPVRRLVKIAGVDYVIELSAAGVLFRRAGSRTRAVAPIAAVLGLATDFAKRDARREALRDRALRRIGQ